MARNNQFTLRVAKQVLERHLEQSALLDAAQVQEPPEAAKLREWLEGETIAGKFVPWWHQRIASAKQWGIDVPPVWDAIASLLDRLFTETCNTFNPFDPRRHVTEENLFPLLKAAGASDPASLTLPQLAVTLQALLDRKADQSPDPPDAVYLGNGRIQVDQSTIVLTEAEDFVLRSLLDLGGSASKPELVKQTGQEHAPRALKRIRDKYAPLANYIFLPGVGGKGKGGYRTTIVDGRA